MVRKKKIDSAILAEIQTVTERKTDVINGYDDVVAEFIERGELRGLSEWTLKSYAKELKALRSYFVEYNVDLTDLTKITEEQAAYFTRYLLDKKYAITTVNTRIVTAKLFFTYCVQKRYVTASPFDNVPLLKKRNYKVVAPSDYTAFSTRLNAGHVVAAATVSVPIAVSVASSEVYTATMIPVTAQMPTYVPPGSSEMIPTGFIADKSLEAIATILDPIVQILVAFSFPVASVIMIGACFLFMFGNSEKAWTMLMNAGLGYVLIQMSPLFLQMLRTVGEAV